MTNLTYDQQIEEILSDVEIDDLSKMVAIQEIEEQQNTYTDGRWDGAIGNAPQHPEQPDYWDGYCSGYQKYWLAKMGRQLIQEM
jgi:hypothetical protein